MRQNLDMIIKPERPDKLSYEQSGVPAHIIQAVAIVKQALERIRKEPLDDPFVMRKRK